MKREDHFRLLASVALIDGHLDASEKERLIALARLMALRPNKALAILKELGKGAKLTGLKIPKRRVLRLALFQDLVLLAAQDGEIVPQEKAFLVKLAPHFGIELTELERLLETSLAAIKTGQYSSPIPTDEAGNLPEVLREAHAAGDGEARARFALRLLRDGEPLPERELPLFLRLADRQRVDEVGVAALLAEPIGTAPQDPLSPRDQRDGTKAFGAIAGLLRLRDLVEGEEDFLARLAAPFCVGRVLLRRTLRVYVPSSQ
ncbi:MAG: TerB family tellurite resistance protein [Planctomycetes bacterium]|nr:TerB family tellurite resistance protein [Planctomycetota bacterium]